VRNDVPITIIGNLTGEPELRFTPGGDAVCKFGVAHNVRKLNKDTGLWEDKGASFYQCTAWRYLAENVAESLHKGDRVLVTGSWAQRQWEDDKGEKRYSWDLTVDAVGPDLTYAQATVRKMARTRTGDVPPDDPWATAARTRPEPAMAGAGATDEPPF
jgi:single-strand DNA-binding protein